MSVGISDYLRDKAAFCGDLARDSKDPKVARSLGQLSRDFLEKAEEMENGGFAVRKTPAAFGSFG